MSNFKLTTPSLVSLPFHILHDTIATLLFLSDQILSIFLQLQVTKCPSSSQPDGILLRLNIDASSTLPIDDISERHRDESKLDIRVECSKRQSDECNPSFVSINGRSYRLINDDIV